jgi:hypothetical protein
VALKILGRREGDRGLLLLIIVIINNLSRGCFIILNFIFIIGEFKLKEEFSAKEEISVSR